MSDNQITEEIEKDIYKAMTDNSFPLDYACKSLALYLVDEYDIKKHSTPKESEEWLVSGCECIYSGELYHYLCKSPFADVAVITKASSEDWDVISADYAELEKPPTPEEELELALINFNGKREESWSWSVLAKAIINGEIKGLSYKPE